MVMTIRQILEELDLRGFENRPQPESINLAISQLAEWLESEKKDFKHQSVEFQNGYITAIDHLIKKLNSN